MLKRLFKLFSKNIIPNDNINNYIVYFYPLKKNKVKVNATLEVPQGFQVVVVYNGKITDILSMGRHKVNGSTMPDIFNKLKLGVPTKRGNYKKYFKAQIFYVNLKPFTNFAFSSDIPFYIRSESFGRIKGFSEGTTTLTVENSEELMKFVLRYCSNFKASKIQDKISKLVGNVVNRVLEKTKLSFSQVLLNPSILDKHFNPAVSNYLQEYGLSAHNVKLVSFKLNNKIQKKVNEFLSNSVNFNQEENYENIIPDLVEIINEKATQTQAESQTENQTQSDNSEPSFYNQTSTVNPILNRRLTSDVEVKTNSNLSVPNLKPEEILTDNSNNLKVCKFCSSTIQIEHKFCPICGFKQQ